MTIEQCNGNFNYMYEFRFLSRTEWYPCHVIEINKGRVCIFTRNGSADSCRIDCVRKMSKDTYLQERNDCIQSFKKFAFEHGYHEDVNEDLKLFEESNELMV